MDYQNGKIYKMFDGDKLIYIGSTKRRLCERLWDHKDKYKYQKIKLYKNIEDISKVKLELYENFPCNSKKELEAREREVYDLFKDECIYQQRPKITKEEKYAINRKWKQGNGKGHCKKYDREYREKNKEKLKARRSEKVTCEQCNKVMSKGSIKRHNDRFHKNE